MIFQEPMTSLNPCFTVGFQIDEAIRTHLGGSRRERRQRAIELMTQVGIPAPERRLGSFPHQMSGGMSQRVMIAMAIACNPKLLIADEPTTALDVTIQAQILQLLVDLQRDRGMALVLITHAMGVVAETAERVVVQYAGQQVEQAERPGPLRRPAPPLHGGPARGAARAGAERRAARLDPGRRAGPVRSAHGLPVQSALQLRGGAVPDGGAARRPPRASAWHAATFALEHGGPTGHPGVAGGRPDERRTDGSRGPLARPQLPGGRRHVPRGCRAACRGRRQLHAGPREAPWPSSASPAAASRPWPAW